MIYPWQQNQWQQLQSQIQKQRLPHAILVLGQAGLGKQDFAQTIAASLLCTDRQDDGQPCGICSACHLLDVGTHPDYLYLAPEAADKAIKVDDIRDLCNSLALTSQFGGYKVAVIALADNMNINAANSLLKTLEEPADNSLLILVSSRPHRLPITIRSRCHMIHFQVPESEQAEQWMVQQNMVEAKGLLGLAHGSPLLAVTLADEELVEQRKSLIQALIGVTKNNPVTEFAAPLSKWPSDYLLAWFYDWIRDLITIKQGTGSALVHHEFQKDLSQIATRASAESLYLMLDEVINLRKVQSIPLNAQMFWEDLLISWKRHTKGTI